MRLENLKLVKKKGYKIFKYHLKIKNDRCLNKYTG